MSEWGRTNRLIPPACAADKAKPMAESTAFPGFSGFLRRPCRPSSTSKSKKYLQQYLADKLEDDLENEFHAATPAPPSGAAYRGDRVHASGRPVRSSPDIPAHRAGDFRPRRWDHVLIIFEVNPRRPGARGVEQSG